MNPVIGSLEKIFRDAEIAARSNEAVLILGETGVGKEVLARHIHDHSPRRHKPFLPINCAAIPTQLMESELFGHERGAFTGALQARRGLLSEAQGGTVLLDEIAEIPLEAQAKLLRTIEMKELRPLGGAREQRLDIRFMAATSADLRARVERHEFRRDLFYRLSIFVYSLPPLRNRLADFPALAQHFISEAGGTAGLSPSSLELFLCYPWPGNVREMRNAISYALAKSDGAATIGVDHLPDPIVSHCRSRDVLQSASVKAKSECFEAHLLAQTLSRYSDPGEAARQAGFGLRTFYRRLKKYGIAPRG